MNTPIDPNWAWSEFQPGPQQEWNQRLVAHLFRRAGFGATHRELTAAVLKTPGQVVDELLSSPQPDAFLNDMQTLAAAAVATGNVQQLSAWWVYRILHTPAQVLEKMTLFWHGHFATSAEKVTGPDLMLAQNELLRSFAFGGFGDLLLEISRDPAMLLYLDSATNRRAQPNENYAREIMELFCLGEGQYTEADIRALARCFTGWEVRRGEFRFNRFQHDAGSKTILGCTGEFGGEDGVRIVLQQQSAAEFIAGKLVRFLVMDEPAADASLIAPLANELRASEFQVQTVLRRILSSNLFYSAMAIGRRIRSPVELAMGLLRSLEGTCNAPFLAESLRTLGQGLFYPPSVKGWDGGRTWINSSTLLGRSNLVRTLITHDKTRFGGSSLKMYLSEHGLTEPQQIIDHLNILLFAVPVPEEAMDRIAQLLAQDADRGLTAGLHALFTLPEFQLG